MRVAENLSEPRREDLISRQQAWINQWRGYRARQSAIRTHDEHGVAIDDGETAEQLLRYWEPQCRQVPTSRAAQNRFLRRYLKRYDGFTWVMSREAFDALLLALGLVVAGNVWGTCWELAGT